MILFHLLTWQQFLITALVLAAIWYAAVGVLYFSDEAAGLFSGKRGVKPGKGPQPDIEGVAGEESESLMGRSREPEGVTSVPINQFSFAGAGRTSDTYASGEEELRETQLRLIPDLIEELKTIFYRLERDGGTKEDFAELFRPVAARFESVITNPSYSAVNAYILENVPFELSEDELAQMWEGSEA